MYPRTLEEALALDATITVHPLKFTKHHYSIRGLPSTHRGWLGLKWMPVKKVFRVTYSPPREGHISSRWINLKDACHTEYNCQTIEEAVQVIQNLADNPLFFNRPD